MQYRLRPRRVETFYFIAPAGRTDPRGSLYVTARLNTAAGHDSNSPPGCALCGQWQADGFLTAKETNRDKTGKPSSSFRRRVSTTLAIGSSRERQNPARLAQADRRSTHANAWNGLPVWFFLTARSHEGDKWSGLTISGYDENTKVLTNTSYTAKGTVETREGTVQGDTGTWSGTGEVTGKRQNNGWLSTSSCRLFTRLRLRWRRRRQLVIGV